MYADPHAPDSTGSRRDAVPAAGGASPASATSGSDSTSRQHGSLSRDNAPIELIILAGFLGSGKTSLLVDLLQSDDRGETGVIVNEAGEIGIDGVIVEDGSQNSVTMLANGCVCCSLRSSLVDTVMSLLDASRPAGHGPLTRIVLETSGLSRPGPIIASLADPLLSSRGLRISVVSTYDCERGLLNIESFDEAAAQLAAAQRIVLTKIDLIAPETVQEHLSAIRGVNPLAQIVADADRTQAVRQAFTAAPASDPVDLALQALLSSDTRAQAHPRIHVLKGTRRAPAEWEDLSIWLDDLAGLCGDRLLRVKAVFNATDCDEPILIQSVGTTFGMPRRMTQRTDTDDICVVITRDIDAADINAAFPDAPVVLTAAAAFPFSQQEAPPLRHFHRGHHA
ncbi:CobW family GTP-binding protein [Bordetella genomosp. 4]|uniref:Cobalamin biosynthesis protein CobW n=1 Tax=Bordetella genomosp. 4 TaxID=463044 RepID=A0A261TMJ1_9BORD|nr:GTP-binding protein [Bordetella genomosp. 4]OZI50477.1 cobalamin biosynthesis protein CobW [Bordetella genomosp. 4]